MQLYQWLCLFGVPSIIATVLTIGYRQIKGIKLGVKALLRAQMIADFNKWMERGYAPIYARENFQNIWEQYHNIKGPNGVMDDIHDRFMQLPPHSPENNKT